MIFKSVLGDCQRSLEESWYDEDEIDEVIRTVKILLPPESVEFGLKYITQTDIGIVTPYRKQRRLIARQLCRFHFNDVRVGTAETFQGNESPVIIISTVRSNGSLGFVHDSKVSADVILRV